MLYESIINNSKDKDTALWSNLSARIAKYHIEETKKSKENTDLVAGNVPFTSSNHSLKYAGKDVCYRICDSDFKDVYK